MTGRSLRNSSDQKRIKITEKRRVANQAAMSKLKTLTKKVLSLKDKETAEAELKAAVSFIDKTASKGRIHTNTAARRKSALTKYVNSLSAAK